MVAPQDESSRMEGRVSDRPVKKDYESPQLKQAGTLEELTRGGAAARNQADVLNVSAN